MFRRRGPVVVRRRPLLRAAVVGGGAYMVGRSRARAQAAQEARFQDLEERTAEAEQAAGEAQYAVQQAPVQQAPVASAVTAAAAEPLSTADQRIAQLQELGRLRNSGVLTDEEFQREKSRILADPA